MAEVDTESLINQAIEARAQREAQRQDLSAKRQRLAQQLGSTNPKNRGQMYQLRSQLSGLDTQERAINAEQRSEDTERNLRVTSAFRNANLAHKASTDELNHQTAQQAGEVFNGFADLMSKTKPGTQAFRDGMTALKEKYPLGFASEAVKGHLGPIAQFHDKEAELNQRKLTDKLFHDFSGMSPQQFASRDVSKDRATNVPILVNAKGEADPKGTSPTYEQIEKLRTAGGRTVAADIGGRTYLFDRNLFENLKSTFGPNQPTDTSVVQGQPNYNVPADVPPPGTNYTFSGTTTPNHLGDYWSEQLPGGQVAHHFARGGSAIMPDVTTPEGAATINAAQQQTAERSKTIEQNPSLLSFRGNIASDLPVSPSTAPQVATLPVGVPPNQPNPDAYISQGTAQVVGQATPPQQTTPAPDHTAALNWANANKDDPRAQEILKRQNLTE